MPVDSRSLQPNDGRAVGTGSRRAESRIDGLITPLSTGTVSPQFKSPEKDSLGSILLKLTQSDFRKSAIAENCSKWLWNEIMAVLPTLPAFPKFTGPELHLIVQEWYSPGLINFQLLEYECFSRDRNSIHSRVMLLEEIYGAKRGLLECAEISALEICHEHSKYLLDHISLLLPEHTREEIAELIGAHFPHKIRWTDEEMGFLRDAISAGTALDDIVINLPFRRPADIKAKYYALAKKLKVTVEVRLSKLRSEYEKNLLKMIDTDLTATGIKAAMPHASFQTITRDLRAIIQERGGSEEVPFTKPELAIVRSRSKDKVTAMQCTAELIFRSKKEIDRQLKKLESVTVRQKKFSSDIERLIYEAKWYSSMAEDSSRSTRRRRGRKDIELDDLWEEAQQPKVERSPETDEELQERKRIMELRNLKRKETRKRNEEEREAMKKTKASVPITRIRRLRNRKRRKGGVSTLLEEAKWFQSITGDGLEIELGAKRRRTPTYHLIPEFKDRQRLKSAQRKLMEEKGPRKRGRPSSTSETSTPETELDEDIMATLQQVMESESLSDQNVISPFDPPDIMNDTTVDFERRQIFNEAISSECLFPLRIPFSPDVLCMLRAGDELPINNILAAQLIREHEKSYKSLGDTFPPLCVTDSNGERIMNPRNILHIRFLLYPQHTEQFVLAAPKSNQLDPINEIIKIFQIHYGIYFSHSEELKNIIYKDYCEALNVAVENNDFPEFMSVIDKWNFLMLELSPYPIEIDPSIDINESLRGYLPRNYLINYDAKDFMLQKFYLEVLSAGEAAKKSAHPVRPPPVKRKMSLTLRLPITTALTPHGQTQAFSTQLPEVFVSRFRHLRPMSYSVAFIDLLTQKSSISRYSVQQLLLRAYIRIVSPQSRKLRSYKAFSAEVYGELLPSFVSEVLTKVSLSPGAKFYDLGSGVGNTTFQAALEFGAGESGGCEIMEHASNLTALQEIFMQKQLRVFGLQPLNLSFALNQTFVDNEEVKKACIDCDVILVNNYLFDFKLNMEVGKLLYGMKTGSKIISLRNFIPPRYKSGNEETILDFLKVEKFEMSDYFSVSWTANKVPYYISTVQAEILDDYL